MTLNNSEYTKWVACWGMATSITKRTEITYSKDLTLRYPVKMCFNGSKLRFRFSNLTGTEDVKVTKAFCAKSGETEYKPLAITKDSSKSFTIPVGQEIESDELPFDVSAGDTIEVSMYFADFTQMNAGTALLTGLEKGYFAYGDYAESKDLPDDLSMATNIFYFLNTIDILTEEKNHALICYGDSITCLDWPNLLAEKAFKNGRGNVSIIRRAVCGTRILRQYDCITYQAYGLKGATRFPIETIVAGASAIIIHHGINDIIHPVGVEVNKFRPWSDMPSVQDLIDGVKKLYIEPAKKMGLKVWSATLLPIYGWRTYTEDRELVRKEFNEWLRTSKAFDGCVDFDKAVCDPQNPKAFAPGCDSGDHLHPSDKACQLMADAVPENLI
ncbi:MAG: lipase [Treponema sp.]|nr:lipase [Treponema sp.]